MSVRTLNETVTTTTEQEVGVAYESPVSDRSLTVKRSVKNENNVVVTVNNDGAHSIVMSMENFLDFVSQAEDFVEGLDSSAF
jgi:hypothetical protein